MRILVDYRPALRQRTGVGEYMHHLVRAYVKRHDGARRKVSVFTSSWKDRPAPELASDLGARVVDRRVPVRVLNYVWHRLEWPPVEALGVTADIVHAAHPLLIPSRRAAQVVTVHDLFFLADPGSTQAEIRRDYAALAHEHAARADAIVTNSHHTASAVARTFGIPPARVHVCSPGPPQWQRLGRAPHVPEGGYALFVGTLEARKNVSALLDAYALLIDAGARPAPLVIAGKSTAQSAPWLERLFRPPLIGRVHHFGYVTNREDLYDGARLLVMPSRDEGFGIPALEAMSAGIPVVAANRGALPEVLGNAGLLIDPDDVTGLAGAIERMLIDRPFAQGCAARGLERARKFSWDRSAASLHKAYETAVARRRLRRLNGGASAGMSELAMKPAPPA